MPKFRDSNKFCSFSHYPNEPDGLQHELNETWITALQMLSHAFVSLYLTKYRTELCTKVEISVYSIKANNIFWMTKNEI